MPEQVELALRFMDDACMASAASTCKSWQLASKLWRADPSELTPLNRMVVARGHAFSAVVKLRDGSGREAMGALKSHAFVVPHAGAATLSAATNAVCCGGSAPPMQGVFRGR